MAQENKIQWSQIRKSLLGLQQSELIGLVKDLYGLSHENRRFLEARFSRTAEQNEAVLADTKQQIDYCFFGKWELSDDLPKLQEARRLIRNYRKATGDLFGTLDLTLFYVETGTKFTNNYGDIGETFYNSLISALIDFCKGLLKTSDPASAYLLFENRLVALKRAAYGIGWGYGDAVQDNVGDLEKRF